MFEFCISFFFFSFILFIYRSVYEHRQYDLCINVEAFLDSLSFRTLNGIPQECRDEKGRSMKNYSRRRKFHKVDERLAKRCPVNEWIYSVNLTRREINGRTSDELSRRLLISDRRSETF